MRTLPDYPDQAALSPAAWGPAFTQLLIEIDGEPGHTVDLAAVIEFDDDPKEQKLLIVLPAGAFDGNGPHALVLTGESRVLALRFVRWRVRMTLQMLALLPE
jgi:hypothetical protein